MPKANTSARTALKSTAEERERAYLVGLQLTAERERWRGEASLEELSLLAETAGADVVGRTLQRAPHPNPATYIGKGKLDEIVKARGHASDDGGTGDGEYTMVIFDDELSPSQQQKLEKALDVKVLDRTALILDIFAMRARTKEGRLQVDLAQTEYLLPRLKGQWSHLERLSGNSGAPGAIGVRGPGETQIETDRRLARNKITKLKKQIEDVRQQRSLYRSRRAREGVPVVALVGYTNAGKSTLMRALTRDADVYVENQLFATLDPLTRRVYLDEATSGAADRHRGVHPEAADAARGVVPGDAGGAVGRDAAAARRRHHAPGRGAPVADGRGDAAGAEDRRQAAADGAEQGGPGGGRGRHGCRAR